MNFYKPDSLKQALQLMGNLSQEKFLLAGGSDINILIRQNRITTQPVIMINHLPELKGIRCASGSLLIGAAATIAEITGSDLIKKTCPMLAESLADFASILISSFATLGGNIANSSPTADTVPLLLVHNAALYLRSSRGSRKVMLTDYYTGYKKTVLKPEELIYTIEIPLLPPEEYSWRYIKVGSRTALTIAKLSLALVKYNSRYRIAAGSLNEFPRRLQNVEAYLNSSKNLFNEQQLLSSLDEDITPISDFRSDAEFRRQVCGNYLIDFLHSLNNPQAGS